MILLVAATPFEIAPVIRHWRQDPSLKKFRSLSVSITGPGLLSTTCHLLKQIYLQRPALVIQAGIAGSFDKRIIPGSVVVVSHERVADEGVVEKGRLKTMADLGFASPNKKPFREGWLVNANKKLLNRAAWRIVKAVTVNQVTTDKKMIARIRKKFHPAIESMEGAALHYICLQEGIPFLQIRAISNFVGDRNKKNWDTGLAVSRLNNNLEFLLQDL